MLVTRHGVTRRLQALRALGWSKNQLARITGLNPITIQRITNDDESPITSKTVATITAAYQRTAWTLPPQHNDDQRRMVAMIRRAASERGWAPPAAWDNIDTDPAPNGVPSDRGCRRPVPIDDALRLLRAGVDPEQVADRIGVSTASLARRLRRHGHHLWAAACERKPGR